MFVSKLLQETLTIMVVETVAICDSVDTDVVVDGAIFRHLQAEESTSPGAYALRHAGAGFGARPRLFIMELVDG